MMSKKSLVEKEINLKTETKLQTLEVTHTVFTDACNTQTSRFTPLKRGDFNLNIVEDWAEVRTKNQPRRRSFHVSFIYNDYMYIHGGIDIVTGKLSDMKRIKIKLDKGELPCWEQVMPIGVQIGKLMN
jgi:hypothetical protein